MDENQAELVSRVLKIAEKVETSNLENTLAMGAAFASLKESKAWMGYYPDAKSWRSFILAAGLKPQTVDNARRVSVRFHKAILDLKSEGCTPIPSRLAQCLTINPEAMSERDIILTLADSNIPHEAFIAGMKQLKGKADTVCNHINLPEGTVNKREQWIKHTCCNTWQLIG